MKENHTKVERNSYNGEKESHIATKIIIKCEIIADTSLGLIKKTCGIIQNTFGIIQNTCGITPDKRSHKLYLFGINYLNYIILIKIYGLNH